MAATRQQRALQIRRGEERRGEERAPRDREEASAGEPSGAAYQASGVHGKRTTTPALVLTLQEGKLQSQCAVGTEIH